MIRRPPRSTLFPTRRSSDLVAWTGPSTTRSTPSASALCSSSLEWHERSEEHTSELQSHSDLVCRLLLEKKKQNMRRRVYPTSTAVNTCALNGRPGTALPSYG